MALKWGIVSTGRICNDFVGALLTLSGDDRRIVAVAAQNLPRAQEFAEKYSISKAYGSYLELAKDPNVEVAYIGNINSQHYDVSRLMLENGKHVLCEKPLCLNEKQAKKLIAYAEQKKLFLMEAIWSRSFPSYQYIKTQIAKGNLGEIKRIDVDFGAPISYEDKTKALCGGTTLDLGVYIIQLAQWVFQQPPKKIVANGQLNEDGVDVEVELTYGENKNSIVKSKISVLSPLKNTAVIIGTKGQITISL